MQKFLKVFYITFIIFLGGKSQASEDIREQEIFKESPKFLVHIGFKEGLPKDGIMRPSNYDPCLYFSLNGPFPKTKLMSKLDDYTNVAIIPVTEELLKRCVSFHPTEVLLIGSLNLIEANATIVCTQKEKIPALFEKERVIRYSDKNLESRNNAVRQFISDKEGYASTIHLDEHETWSNLSVVSTHINGKAFNINDNNLYTRELNGKITYSCPANCQEYANLQWSYAKIGLLSELKRILHAKDFPGKQEEIKQLSDALVNWVASLDYINENLKGEFTTQVQTMIKSSNFLDILKRKVASFFSSK